MRAQVIELTHSYIYLEEKKGVPFLRAIYGANCGDSNFSQFSWAFFGFGGGKKFFVLLIKMKFIREIDFLAKQGSEGGSLVIVIECFSNMDKFFLFF